MENPYNLQKKQQLAKDYPFLGTAEPHVGGMNTHVDGQLVTMTPMEKRAVVKITDATPDSNGFYKAILVNAFNLYGAGIGSGQSANPIVRLNLSLSLTIPKVNDLASAEWTGFTGATNPFTGAASDAADRNIRLYTGTLGSSTGIDWVQIDSDSGSTPVFDIVPKGSVCLWKGLMQTLNVGTSGSECGTRFNAATDKCWVFSTTYINDSVVKSEHLRKGERYMAYRVGSYQNINAGDTQAYPLYALKCEEARKITRCQITSGLMSGGPAMNGVVYNSPDAGTTYVAGGVIPILDLSTSGMKYSSYHPDNGCWELLGGGGGKTRYAVQYGCTTKGTSGVSCHSAEGYISDCNGNYSGTDLITYFWTVQNNVFPNSISGNVRHINYNDDLGIWEAADGLDEFVGSIKFTNINDIPQGWACYNNMSGRTVMGTCISGTLEQTGGSTTVAPNFCVSVATVASGLAGSTRVVGANDDCTLATGFFSPYIKLSPIIRVDNSCGGMSFRMLDPITNQDITPEASKSCCGMQHRNV